MLPQQTAEHRRVFFLTTVSSNAYPAGIVFAAGLLVIYFATNAWQLLPIAFATLLGSAITYAARQQIPKGHTWTATLLIIIAISITFPLWSLFLAGTETMIALIALTWFTHGVFVLLSTPPDIRRAFVTIASILSTIAILLISTYDPFPRLVIFDPNNISILRWLFPLAFTLGSTLVILITIRGILTGRLLTRITISFLMLVAIPIITLTANSIINGSSVISTEIGMVVVSNIAIGALTLIAAAVSAYYLIGMISVPLNNLTKTARQLADGNLNARANYVEQEDEIGELASAFNDMAGQLQGLVMKSEERATEQSRSLESRSRDFEIAAQIAHDASIAPSTDEILSRTAQMIHDQFGYYYVGVFIIDENNEFAVLRAAAGDAGKLMLANKFKTRIGDTNPIGAVAQTGELYILSDTDTDALYFQNPLLPYTRSEMTLPLKGGGKVIGVLDVQSDSANEFDQSSAAIMQVITNQISISVERVDLLQELTQNAERIEQSYQENAVSVWRTFLQRTRKYSGYRYDGALIEPFMSPSSVSLDVLKQGKSVTTRGKTDNNSCTLAVPIRLRGQILGTLNLLFQSPEIPQDVVRLVEEAADHLALALENARLIQDAQRLAKREQQINTISAQIQQSTELEIVLQNTVRELGNTLGVPKAFIQIGLTPSGNKQKSKKDKRRS